MTAHILRASRVLTQVNDGRAEWLRDAAVLVRDGVIAEVGATSAMEAAHPYATVVGGAGAVLIPGLINAHHHVGVTPFQLGSADHPLETWFAARLALRDVDPRLDTLYSAMEMLASGVTTVQHLHSRAAGDAEAVLRTAGGIMGAYEEIGMRASYSFALRDQNRVVYGDDATFTDTVPLDLQPALRDYFARFTMPLDMQLDLQRDLLRHTSASGRVRTQLAPANLHWLSDEALGAVAMLSETTGAGMHMHVVETPYQREYAKRRTGLTAVEYLDRFGLVSERLTAGHATWVSASDIERLADAGASVCHNCSSNFRLASGRAPVTELVRAGVRVALGIDEAGINDDRDMLQEMRLAFVTNRHPGIDADRLSAADVIQMATIGGAATTPFGDHVGRIAPGCAADLVLLDETEITSPYQSPLRPFEEILVQRAKPTAVRDVMVAGEWVIRNGAFVTIDRAALLSELAAQLAAPLSPAEEARIELAERSLPFVAAFYEDYQVSGHRRS